MPKEDVFFDLLKKQSLTVFEAGKLFGKLMRDFDDLSLKEKQVRFKEIDKLEHEADNLTHETVKMLHKNFITPIDREDIHNLTELLDDLIDLMEDISRKLLQYGIEEIPKNLFDLSVISLRSLHEVHNAVSCLKKPGSIGTHLIRIHELEDEGDEVYYKAITALFKKEKNAVKIIKLKDLYEEVETLLDKTQDVACVIEGIVIKHA